MTAAHDYSDLHRLIDRLEPEQAAEIKEHALRLVGGGVGRFRVLRPFDGPATDLGAQAVRGARGSSVVSDSEADMRSVRQVHAGRG